MKCIENKLPFCSLCITRLNKRNICSVVFDIEKKNLVLHSGNGEDDQPDLLDLLNKEKEGNWRLIKFEGHGVTYQNIKGRNKSSGFLQLIPTLNIYLTFRYRKS